MQNKRFWSEAYQRFLHFRVTTAVIKQVKQLQGGIDEYLRTTPNDQLLYQKAIKMKGNMLYRSRIRKREAALDALNGMEATLPASPALVPPGVL